MRDLTERVSEKEEDLAALKKLFVDKLRELESSFVELSQDMIDSESVQQEAVASRKASYHQAKQQQALSQKSNQARDLEKSLEHIVGRIDDDYDEQIEQLVALNEQLSDENRELREHVKDLSKELESNSDMDVMRQQFQELHDIALSKEEALKEVTEEKLAIDAQMKKLNGKLEELKSKVEFLTQALSMSGSNYNMQD